MMMIFLYLLLGLVALSLLIAYICFRMAFLVVKRSDAEIPPGKEYEPYRAQLKKWMEEARNMPCEEMEVTSFDGLKLRGKYYECIPGAPMELMFHGYRGNGERDLCGGIQRAFAIGRNVLIVDQRAGGRSEGRVITFGVNESMDCVTWANHLQERFGPELKLIITGVSMGAATVMMATARELPPCVVGVLADCGYTSARDIIKKVIRDMKLPADLLYPFVRLGAILFGKFDPDSITAEQAMRNCKLPVIFAHGEADNFVPCEMSRRNYEACAGPKVLLTVPGAGHGLCYPADQEGYIKKLKEFNEVLGLP
jgi:fermentation-respiration switch protein FrsA (DUF1100 family)